MCCDSDGASWNAPVFNVRCRAAGTMGCWCMLSVQWHCIQHTVSCIHGASTRACVYVCVSSIAHHQSCRLCVYLSPMVSFMSTYYTSKQSVLGCVRMCNFAVGRNLLISACALHACRPLFTASVRWYVLWHGLLHPLEEISQICCFQHK